ncbi:hypothetical protein [Sporosalibacterium faouarense]|uniref:hypothetical protein n=1 Tax=Sporosalibacterium faouarense TaxID=516123 RepID=UPI00141C4D39|nr:hypothetical protein [Sporosalibacterium faouarense]MTI48661.1 hypothetical protein [Bacillota bacterium]
MSTKIIFLILLVLSGSEIFFNIFTKLINLIFSVFGDKIKLGEKSKTVIKMISVAIFFISVVYFLIVGIYKLADLLGIPLDKSFLELL